MAPPLGNREDRAELRRAVKDGAVMFATDHAPHPAETKNVGFLRSANGIISLECAVAATYRAMVEEEGMDVGEWAKAWWEKPRSIISGADGSLGATRIAVGENWKVDVDSFASLSRNCPYGGMEFSCRTVR
jgi:dihydroorotase